MKHSVPSKLVLIGASTGGPGQVEKIISSLDLLTDTTVIIAQHMVEGFIPSFSSRLKERNINIITMAEDTQRLQASHIYLCDGLTTVTKKDFQLFFSKKPSSANQYNPDINILFNSFIPFTKNMEILCVILTGIGEDGVDATKELSLNGARSITETKESAIVDGMPYRAREIVPNIEVHHINGIITKIKEFCR